jgi:hypothetical protein
MLPIINYWKHKITAASAILSFNIFFGFKSNKDAQNLFYHLFKNDILNLSRNFEQQVINFAKKIFNYANCILYGFYKNTVLYSGFLLYFKFLAKLLLPLIVKKVVKKAGENYQQQQEKAQDAFWKRAIQR